MINRFHIDHVVLCDSFMLLLSGLTGLDSILLSSDESEDDSDIKSDPTFPFNLPVAVPPLLLLSMLLRAMEFVGVFNL